MMDALLSIGKQQAGSTGSALSGVRQQEHPFDMAALSSQAQSLWKMLDEMAENDPQAYKQFIQQQAEAAAAAAPPVKDAAAVVLVVVADGSASSSRHLALHIWPAQGCEPPSLPTSDSISQTILTRQPAADSSSSASNWVAGVTVPLARVKPPQGWQPPVGLSSNPSRGAADQQGASRACEHHHLGLHPRLLQMVASSGSPHDASATSSSNGMQASSMREVGSCMGGASAMSAVLVEAVCQAAEGWLGVKLDRSTCRLLVSKSWLQQATHTVMNAGVSTAVGPSAGVLKACTTRSQATAHSNSTGNKPVRAGPLIQELS